MSSTSKILALRKIKSGLFIQIGIIEKNKLQYAELKLGGDNRNNGIQVSVIRTIAIESC